MSSMKITRHRLDAAGALNALLMPLVVVSLLLVLAAVFGVWAYSGMQDYKNNVDEKVADAVSVAEKKQSAKDAAAYAEEAKNPHKTYNGPAAYGGVKVEYPRLWNAYVIEQASGGTSIDGYFNPNFVPAVTVNANSFAARIRVLNQTYASAMQSFQSAIKAGKATATPYAFPNVPGVIGTKIDGQIAVGKQGTMVVVPLRANALEVWTEGTQYKDDFNKHILPNVTFAP